jgi:ABC-2 type transport system permease protein
MLLIDGLWFQVKALGAGARLSSDVLAEFFNGASGTTMIAAVALSIRLLAQEREKGTLVLLNTAPIRDSEIVLGKFLSLFFLLSGITALTVYMPMLIFVNGRVSIGHILVGYAGVLLLGAASIAIGVFASAVAKTQVISAILAALLMGTMLLLWMVAKVTDPPLNELLNALALHHERQRPFMLGLLKLENVVYYVVIAYFFLLAATKVLEARRWK